MRDYDEEAAVLHSLGESLADFPVFGSYNGKSFDIPLLQSRFLLNRYRLELTQRPHLDLLYPSKRLWSRKLSSCALGQIEEHILKRIRDEDIPGSQIPYVYFDFLRGQSLQRMRPVLRHNAEDIYSLALLTIKLCQIFKEPFEQCENGSEWVGMARCMVAGNDMASACECYEKAIQLHDLDIQEMTLAKRHLSLLYKRLEQFDKAICLWESIRESDDNLFAYLELAKYYEHKAKDFKLALHITEEALRLEGLHEEYWDRDVDETDSAYPLLYRRKRLLQKSHKTF
jgi:hypothetical protein